LIRIVTLILLIFSSAQGISNESAREYFKFAKFSFDAREYDQAIEFINKAIEIDPDLVAAYRSRDSILDKTPDSRLMMEDTEIADHLAAMRVAQFTGEKRLPGS